MRDIEKRSADAGIPWQVLMDNAGLEFALAIKRIAGDIAGCPVVFLIGPGNNGGDGLVAARHLHDWGATVHLYLCAARNPEDHNFVLTRQRNIPFTEMTEDRDLAILHTALSSAQVVVDAVLGTGKMRSIEGSLKEVLSSVSRVKAENPDLIIAAVDLPTGLDADSGACDPSCLIADITVTFGFPKVGFFAFPAYNRIGQLVVADIGFQMDNFKYTIDYADADATDPDDYEDKYSVLPYFKIGIDAHVFKWMDFRCGVNKYWVKNTYEPNAATKWVWSYAATSTYLGAGFHWGRFTIDAAINPDFLENGPYFISGEDDYLTERVTLKYAF